MRFFFNLAIDFNQFSTSLRDTGAVAVTTGLPFHYEVDKTTVKFIDMRPCTPIRQTKMARSNSN